MAAYLTPVEVTPGAADAWTDVDVSSSVPAGATGVILHTVCVSGVNEPFGLRKNGSTDNRTGSFRSGDLGESTHAWQVIGVDASRIFEAYIGSTTDIDIYLVGYFTSAEATFFTNATDKSTGTTGSWVDVDISADTGADTAVGAFLEILNPAERGWGLRKNGSTDSRVLLSDGHVWGAMGVDGSEILEQQIDETTVDIFLIGYAKTNATFNTNASDRSTGTTGSYVDIAALGASAVGGIYEIYNTANSGSLYALRKNGSAEDIYSAHFSHCFGMPECDASGLVEQKIAATSTDLFEIGYLTGTVAATTTPRMALMGVG